jgi:Helix-turn-helix domain
MKAAPVSELTGLRRRMRLFRDWFGMTQKEAALSAQVSLATWSRWERGSPIPYREWQRLQALIDEWMSDGDVEGAPWALRFRNPEQLPTDASARGGSRRV